jgi:TetR/AcrR family transcriptional repressor of mexJK operon
MQPRVLRLRRLVIGEAARFPQLGRTFYQGGVGQTVDTLGDDHGMSADDLDKYADAGVDTFLAAYAASAD